MKLTQPDITTAIRIFYSYTEIGNKQIEELFGKVSSRTQSLLKQKARAVMVERGKETANPFNVNTICAYDSWGLDVPDMEKRLTKLKKLGFVS